MKNFEKIQDIIEETIEKTSNHKIKENLKKLIPRIGIINKIQKKDLTLEEYNNIIRKICLALYPEIESKYPFRNWKEENQSLSSKLTIALISSYNFQYRISFKDRKIKVYPISLDEKTAKEIYKNELLTIIQEHLKSNLSIEDIIEEHIESHEKKINTYKETLTNSKVEPYYGTPKFMYEHASYINDCLQKLPFETKSLDKELNEMHKFIVLYPEVGQESYTDIYPYYNMTYKQAYDQFEKLYLSILSYENSLVPQVSIIWEQYLTNPKNHQNDFHYLIHTFTDGLVPPKEMNKACCSLATNNLLTVVQGTSGLIYGYTPESIDTISKKDAGSFYFDKEKFIDQNIPLDCQYTPENMAYEDPKISKLILPTDLEKTGIDNNLVYNHELLNYETFCAYTELVLNKKAQALGVFYTDDCPNIEEIKEYAKKYNLPLIHLSLQELRTKQGLNPTPKKEDENKEVNIPHR